MLGLNLEELKGVIDHCDLYSSAGKLRSAIGLLTCSLRAGVGDRCEILRPPEAPVLGEVIGFRDGLAYVMPFDAAVGLRSGLTVVRSRRADTIPAGHGLLGRVIDGLGRPVDDAGPLVGCSPVPVRGTSPSAMQRTRIRQPFTTGQRVIDGLLTCGLGQRVGIFAGSGVGKSTLLGEIARGSEADVNVVALIGERGREVRPFLEDCLGLEGMRRSIVVVATCEETPLLRVRAAHTALALADHFRASGANVLFMLDSLTRLAMAQREIGLSLGEPPSARGYTPSVFQLLATTVERLGNAAVGGTTALLTVLVDGDDLDEPIADAVRSLVDGHICLDRKLAERGHYPAVDVARSISRVAHEIVTREHTLSARKLRAILATYAEVEDLLRIGAYVRGSSPPTDQAIELMPAVRAFLIQAAGERSSFAATTAALTKLTAGWNH
jgi:flagellum-specific ATP synthase